MKEHVWYDPFYDFIFIVKTELEFEPYNGKNYQSVRVSQECYSYSEMFLYKNIIPCIYLGEL